MLKLPPPIWALIFLGAAYGAGRLYDFKSLAEIRIVPLGIAFWVGLLPYFAVPALVFLTTNFVHIPFEEAKMRRQFGAEYDAYCQRVRRWI